MKILQDEVIRMRALFETYMKIKQTDRLFVKNDKKDDKKSNGQLLSINKWSIYTAYRYFSSSFSSH